MSLSPLALSLKRRKNHPYRSLYAEMLFQGFRDALAEAHEEGSTVQKSVEDSPSAGSEEKRTRRESKRKRHRGTQLPEGSCPQQ
jgi:hypothetical protein